MPIYFDNAATSFPKPESVYAAIDEAHRNLAFAAGRGSYRRSVEVTRMLDQARVAITKLIGIRSPETVSFCFSGTDALSTAIFGLLDPGDHVVATAADHSSVLRPLWHLESAGIELTVVDCDLSGKVQPADIEAAFQSNTKLVCVTHASNVTGVVQPVEEIGKLCQRRDVIFLLDAAQTIGHLEINVPRIGCDLIAAPGHKGLHGPMGTGFLYANERAAQVMRPLRFGGTGSNGNQFRQPQSYPQKFESGNLNVPGVAGLLAGLEWLESADAKSRIETLDQNVQRLRDALTDTPHVTVYGDDALSFTPTISLNVDGIDCQTTGMILDSEFQIECRTGMHCAPLIHEPIQSSSHSGTVRLSPGLFTVESEIDTVIEAVRTIANQMKASI